MFKKAKKNNIDELINAVIALYLRLLQIDSQDIGKREVNILYNIIKSAFKEKEIPPIQQIQKLIENPYSLEQGVKIIKNHLFYPDQIKLLMNLLVIAHLDNEFSIPERIDILDVVERLEIDNKEYFHIIELIENKSKFIDVQLDKFAIHLKDTRFANFLIFGENVDSDLKIKENELLDFSFIIIFIENIVLIGSFVENKYRIGSELLQPNRLYKLSEDEIFYLSDPFARMVLQLSYNEILQLYENKKQDVTQVIKYAKELFGFDILQEKNKIKIQPFKGEICINGNVLNFKRKYELAINDSIIINNVFEFSTLDILTEKLSFREKRTFETLYINSSDKFFQISEEKTSHSLARINKNEDTLTITPINKTNPLALNYRTLSIETGFVINKDIISVGKTNFKINRYFDIIKIEYEIKTLNVNYLRHSFKDAEKTVLDEISFNVKKGEFLSIMGASGSGKTTLLKCLIGEIIPLEAKIEIDDYDFFDNLSYFQEFMGYVPQDDLLFENLTVNENLYYCGRLRLPHITNPEIIKKKIDNILVQIGLLDKKDMVVGTILDKKLSGGERKRLNIALELLSEPIIIVLDEPTSGLSSKDSEKIIAMLTDLKDQGKIIIATIHQPNPNIFQQFDKVLLIDSDGTQIFFGNTTEVFDYFDEELSELTFDTERLLRKKELKMAEYLFDISQYPLLDKSGNLIYKIDNSSEIKEEQRKYPSQHWKTKFKKHQILEIIHGSEHRKTLPPKKDERSKFSHKKLNLQEHLSQIYYLFVRNLKNKMKNKTNLFVTFLAAPILAIFISVILRYSQPESSYSFGANINMPIFIFISVIVFIFLGLSNSLDEIISERRIISREKKINIKTGYYLLAKNLTLPIFALIQSILYFFIASIILEIRGVFFVYIIYLLLSAFIGYSLGLLGSSLLKDKKALINLLPLVLIPQIIFGGAVIEFEKMNRKIRINAENVIPEFCQFIPSRWLFEGLFTAQAKLNSYTREISKFNKEQKINNRLKKENLITSNQYLKKQKKIKKGKTNILQNYETENFVNEQINFAVDIIDGKFYNNKKNYFLSSMKIFFGKVFKTYNMNVLIILFYGFIINLLTYFSIQFYFKRKLR